MFDASSERVPDRRYQGMNPNFVRQVWAKRREERAKLPKQPRLPEPIQKAKSLLPAPEKKIQELNADEIVANFRVIIPGTSSTKPKGKDIIKRVCWEHEMSVAAVVGPSRNKQIVAVRHAAMAEVHMHTDLTLTQIGKLFNRDHTSVLHGIGKHMKRMGIDHPAARRAERRCEQMRVKHLEYSKAA